MDHKEAKFNYFGDNWLQPKQLKMKKLQCTEEMQEFCSPREWTKQRSEELRHEGSIHPFLRIPGVRQHRQHTWTLWAHTSATAQNPGISHTLKSLMGVNSSSPGHGEGLLEKEANEISNRAAFHQCTLRACSCQTTSPSHRGVAANSTQHCLELWNFNSCPSRLEYQLQTLCKNTGEVWSCPPQITP